ncbi:ABC transporter substrate-binding protein [Pseudomonas sp. BIGb0164]|uniref:ABC transporter substrate-binding protein n=1 Tax=Pseudomonas sp. BIGb0164 TaxID=2940605 RepID=UPI00216802A1|nr:ABC transporter substrate-binding protein [Pseudomonas sp. BIGb0164]MCS4246179.1 ABC-type transport system substrate-binding protein [Pseudomonas sp. BIGb0164]
MGRLKLLAALIGSLLAFNVLALSTGNAAFAQAKEQGQITFVQGSDIDTLDPAISRSVPSYNVIDHVFNRLVAWEGHDHERFMPDLAQSWSRTEDGKQWTFVLRQGVKFHDGTDFNALAVKFNLDRIRDPKLGSPHRSYYADIVAVDAVAPYELRITTQHPSPTMLELLAKQSSSISSPAAVAKYGRAYGHHPVGTGPYVFDSWIPNDQAVIERNNGFFGEPGKPSRIVFRPVKEDASRVIELRTQNADIAANLSPEAAMELKALNTSTLLRVPSTFQVFFEMNLTKPPFDDPRIRRAVSLAIDRQALVNKVLLGYGKVPTGPFPEGTQARRAFAPVQYDPQKARQIINEVYPGGYPGTVVLWTPAGRYTKDRQVAEVVQGYLNAVGLKTEFKVWEWATYQKNLYRPEPGKGTGKGSNDANMWLLGTGLSDADIRLRRKLSSGDPQNLTGYSNPEVDTLLQLAARELDQQKRMAYYGQIQQILWEQDPDNLPLFDQEQVMGLRKGLNGLDVDYEGTLDFKNVEFSER